MTPKEIARAYPGASLAVSWCELIIRANGLDGEPCAWDDIKAVPGITPRIAAELIRESLGEELLEGSGTDGMRVAYAEMSTPVFLSYVAGLLGAV